MADNKIQLSGIFAEGYGIIPKKLMRMKNIDIKLKAILAYMLSFTGGGDTCFPGIRTMSDDLNISHTTVIKYIKEAVKLKIIHKSKLNDNPMNHANKYKLVFLEHDVPGAGTSDVPGAGTSKVQQVEQNNNTINNNNINNNTSIYIDENVHTLFTIWKENGLTQHNQSTVDRNIKKKHRDIVNDIGIDKAIQAVRNYATVLTGDQYYWTHEYTFWDFIGRKIDSFTAESKPLHNFLKKGITYDAAAEEKKSDYYRKNKEVLNHPDIPVWAQKGKK